MAVIPIAAVLSLGALLPMLYYINYAPTTSGDKETDLPPNIITGMCLENQLQEDLKFDKGMGCEIPELDPFSEEMMQFDDKPIDIKCHGQDWVKCYHSKCRVVESVKDTVKDITCTFNDILYESDDKYTFGPPTQVDGDGIYELKESDHVKVKCVGKRKLFGSLEYFLGFFENFLGHLLQVTWMGNTLGFRPVSPLPAPPGREHSFNVVIFVYDSTARNGFIRKMPKSWQMLKNIGATVMEGYNIVGDGSREVLIPILTGKSPIELLDIRKSKHNNATADSLPLIFYKLKQDGYRTAYFEDAPEYATFQFLFNGFRHQPADHYLRALLMEDITTRPSEGILSYCLGDTPGFKVMMNVTEQFLDLGGKSFIFTFIVDISHGHFNAIQNADDDTAAFLRGLLSRAEDTLIVVMGDHGPRFDRNRERDTLQGKLEERLPLLALSLPDRLRRARPHAQRALEANAHALSTPHDLHATILDVLDMRQHWNPYKIPGADYTRGLTMLEPIPRNRSCSEAGIGLHYCACTVWQNVSTKDPLFEKTAHALVNYINSLVATVRVLCVPRTLISTSWVLRQRVNSQLLAYRKSDADGYGDYFGAKKRVAKENYQIKIVVGPGRSIYEATMSYVVNEDTFIINNRDISRTSRYRHEADCISNTHPHLNKYCYCRKRFF